MPISIKIPAHIIPILHPRDFHTLFSTVADPFCEPPHSVLQTLPPYCTHHAPYSKHYLPHTTFSIHSLPHSIYCSILQTPTLHPSASILQLPSSTDHPHTTPPILHPHTISITRLLSFIPLVSHSVFSAYKCFLISERLLFNWCVFLRKCC